jgi:hypothetical protein
MTVSDFLGPSHLDDGSVPADFKLVANVPFAEQNTIEPQSGRFGS